MNWTIDTDSEPGYFLVRCGDVVDSRWVSLGAAEQRKAQLAVARESMVAAAGEDDPAELGRAFYAVLCIDEWDAGDGRYFEHFEWMPVPLSLWTLDSNEGGGHYGAEASGSIRTIERLSDNRRIFATGYLATTEEGQQTEAQIEQQVLRFVSVDPAQGTEWDEEIVSIGTDGWPIDMRMRFTNYVIGGATVLGSPAIRWAVIWLDGMDAPTELTMPLPAPIDRVTVPDVVDVEDDQDIIVIMASANEALEPVEHAAVVADTPEVRALLASARAERDSAPGACVLTRECGGPALPPLTMFRDPQFEEATPWVVDQDGWLRGYLALFETPHRGFLHYDWSDRIFAPRSQTGYAHFLTNRTPVACCDDHACGHAPQFIMTGVLTVGTTHAGRRLSGPAAQAFYENSGLQVADVVIGEDSRGIWASGPLRPGLDDARVREVLASAPSGDWRRIGNNLELCAVLGVNCPGFPILASSYVEDGEVQTLIAGWTPPAPEPDEALVASVGSTLRRRAPERPAAGLRAELTVDVGTLERAVTAAVAEAVRPLAADLRALQPVVAEQLDQELAALDA